jgi:probable phosphoglycerate mutase
METASPVAAVHGMTPSISSELGEMHFGDWEGLHFETLDQSDDWKRFNMVRGFVRPPGGELMIEVQARMVRRLDCLRQQHPGETVAVVSHADPIRAAIAFYLDIPLHSLLRFDISPASWSVVDLTEWGPHVRTMNQTGAPAI